MRIVLDLQGAQTIGSRNRGIGRYSMGLAGGMARAAGPWVDLRIVLNGAFPDTIEPIINALSADLPRDAFSVYFPPEGAIWPPPPEGDPAQAALAAAARLHYASLEPDAVLLSSAMEGVGFGDVAGFDPALPNVLSAAVFHDLTPLHDSERFLSSPPIHAYYHRQLDVFRSVDRLLANSDATRADGLENLGRHADEIVTIGAATASVFRTRLKGPPGPHLPSEPYILLLGGVDPNKNLACGIEAAGHLPAELREDYTLLHCGVLERKARDALEAQMRGRMPMRFLGHVTDDELINALDHAEVVLFPSRLEGFGLPALEAMTRGTPVLASNTTSLPEVVGDPDLLCDPDNPEEMSKRLETLLRDPARRTTVGHRLRARSERFTWDAVGRRALDALAAAVEARPGGDGLRPAPTYDADAAIADAVPAVAAGGLPAGRVIDSLLQSGRVGAELGTPRLLVDVTVTNTSDAGTGIQRVVNATVGHLHHALVADGGARAMVPVALNGRALRGAPRFGAPSDAPIRFRAGETMLMLDSSWNQYPDFAPAFADLRGHGGRVVTTVYDLTPLLHPAVVIRGMPEVFDAWFRRALVESDGLVCISRAVADEVAAYIRAHGLPHRDGLRIGWWHLGSDLPAGEGEGARPQGALARFLAVTTPTFLMVGTVEPRKRHATALEAMERLWAGGSPARLLIMGRQGWNIEEFAERLRNHPEAGARLLWLEGPSDTELAHAYRAASALLFPSLYEGYGLPIVEAARMGLGAICSDIPVLREVGGEGAMYAPVGDVQKWAEAISAVADDRALPDPSHTPALSWDESTRHLLEVLYADRWRHVLRTPNMEDEAGDANFPERTEK
ncbi:glycosyltransferase involved in cell wall biosynthesis [Hasllibacter halocynthiae]|uniref:Glycosyltransferase involved in cell wall biosynthesis n=1 Tax=Hasllibacter halocynthiae TaxID=595589 RepID=A0A2T0X1I9_9RHOB|nr:glycosyltransferase family 1 protein [Hasllibacter halocynthiae]PRY92816.1 glycosyltransferase involved in cell wall biosynthesis [Hasllibacter halocynthiae]